MMLMLALTGQELPDSSPGLDDAASSLRKAASDVQEVSKEARTAGAEVISANQGPGVDAFADYFSQPHATPHVSNVLADELTAAASAVSSAAHIVKMAREQMIFVASVAEAQLKTMLAASNPFAAVAAAQLIQHTREQLQRIDRTHSVEVEGALATIAFTMPMGGPSESVSEVDGYRQGPPARPDIPWDDDYPVGSEEATLEDWIKWHEWGAKLNGARLLRPDLDDALDMYSHYRSNSGADFDFDYEEAIREDSSIKANVEIEITRAAEAIDQMAQQGETTFQVSGEAHPHTRYPETENWQKTIGGYQQWSSANVQVKDGMVTMEITVHAEDHYNFNKGQNDIATQAPDDENGRFQAIGWAKGFDSHGSVTRTVTWPVGSPPSHYIVEPNESQR